MSDAPPEGDRSVDPVALQRSTYELAPGEALCVHLRDRLARATVADLRGASLVVGIPYLFQGSTLASCDIAVSSSLRAVVCCAFAVVRCLIPVAFCSQENLLPVGAGVSLEVAVARRLVALVGD